MKPLNQPERRTRLWQFVLLYLLALAIPLGASYYLFSNRSIADENARLKKELDRTHQEQGRLLVQFDTLTHHLQRIDATDQQLRSEANPIVLGKLTTNNQDYLNAIAVGLNQLRLDSAQMQIPAHRRLTRDILRDFDLFRSNRTTMDALRQDLVKRGEAAQGTERLSEQLNQARQQIIMLQASLSRPPAAPSGGGGGAAAPAPPSVSAALRQQIALLQDQVAFANADCLRQRALEKKSRSKERKQLLQASRTAFIQILQAPATEDLKQSVEKTLEPINVELGRAPRFFGLL
jgi:hypothetical protein